MEMLVNQFYKKSISTEVCRAHLEYLRQSNFLNESEDISTLAWQPLSNFSFHKPQRSGLHRNFLVPHGGNCFSSR